jgi:hypothetical protein
LQRPVERAVGIRKGLIGGVHVNERKIATLDCMSPGEVRNNDTTESATFPAVDMKLEVAVIPVSYVDRAKEFYTQLGEAE